MKVEEQDGVTTIHLQGNLTSDKVADLRTRLLELINGGADRLTLDMAQVKTVDSAGFGVLISTQNSLKSKSGALRVINVAAKIAKIMKIMRLDKHFEILTAE